MKPRLFYVHFNDNLDMPFTEDDLERLRGAFDRVAKNIFDITVTKVEVVPNDGIEGDDSETPDIL